MHEFVFTNTAEISARLSQFSQFIGYLSLSISGQTYEFMIYAMRQRAKVDNLTICYRKKQVNKSTPVFHVSVQLLIMNFIITLSK